jgi:hypothetical protein
MIVTTGGTSLAPAGLRLGDIDQDGFAFGVRDRDAKQLDCGLANSISLDND